MKDEFGRKIVKEFASMRPKMHSHIKDDVCVYKKAKSTKKVCNQMRKIKFQYFKKFVENNNEAHNLFTEKIIKLNDDKGVKTSDRITTYLYGYTF